MLGGVAADAWIWDFWGAEEVVGKGEVARMCMYIVGEKLVVLPARG